METYDENSSSDYLRAALQAAQAAAEISRNYYNGNFTVTTKDDLTPVTQADIECEEKIREIILQQFPEHGFFGEETGRTRDDADHLWLVDPIDGTKSFISGMTTFGTLIGLTHQSSAQVGVIDMPMLGECWIGIKGKETTLNGEKCQVSDIRSLDQAILYCTEPDMFEQRQLQDFERLSNAVQLRRFGGDCYSYGLLASGQIDLIVEGSLHYYDIMALIPVVEGAGGIITDWQGQPLEKDWDGLVVAAATKELHQAALNMLAQ